MPNIEFPGRGPLWLPEKFKEFRPHQIDAVNEVLEHFDDGAHLVNVDAPTGAGKTLIGEAVRLLHPSRKALYVCTTKTLQDQFLEDFDYALLIKGRANYPTFDDPESFAYGLNAGMCDIETRYDGAPPGCSVCYSPNTPDVAYEANAYRGKAENPTYRHCDFCHPYQACPYRVAKTAALAAPLAVANTAYFMYEAGNVGGFGDQSFVIVDEADTLESLIMSYMRVDLSRWRLKQAGIKQPKQKTIAASWLPWATDAEKALKAQISFLKREVHTSRGKERYKKVQERDRVVKALSSVVRFGAELAIDPDNWVYDGSAGGVSFRPVEVKRFGENVLWRHSRNFMLMSATLISPASMMEFLGYKKKWATVTVNSNFHTEKRPVWVCPAANMTMKLRDTEWPKMVEAVSAVLDRHPDLRILVHTVSYEFTSYLHEHLRERHGARLLSYANAGEREATLERFRSSKAGVVLAPSFDRGVDLPDNDARVIVVTKVPFPYLGDKQVSQRLYGTGIAGKTWYSMETIRSLVQMTGRGMRHEDDWCISYVLDRQFASNIWKNQRRLIPKWWQDSLKWGPPTNGGAEAVLRADVPGRLG